MTTRSSTATTSAPAGERSRGRVGVRACGHEPGPATGPLEILSVADPGDATAEARPVVDEVLTLYRALADCTDLAPGPVTDALFSRLVTLAIAARTDAVATAVLGDPAVAEVVDDLRALCARGEAAMERCWAHRITSAADPAAELARFPYRDNYRDLTRLEVHAVAGHLPHPPRRMLFVGSGPLPLTALMLARHHGVEVVGLDLDPEAAALGADVARALGVDGVRFDVGDVLGTDDLGGYDAVCLAALVGLDAATKARVLGHVRARLAPGALVLVRSAHSLRGLLYPAVTPGELAGLELLAVVHPFTDVVNSVVLARVPAS